MKLSGLVFGLLLGYLSFGMGLSDDDAHANTSEPEDIILFMFVGLCVGIITMQVLSRLGEPVPYTVVIFIFGIVCSTLSKTHLSDALTTSINDWVNIDAELIVYIFLPPLIFGEAMNQNWHHVKGAVTPSLILAGPGVVIGAGLMAVIAKYMLPYDWSWNVALVFGSILSATDTVAVLSLLKSAGASAQLTMFIVGESLVNDGTAMVLFTLFFEMLKGTSYTPMDIFQFFTNATLGSSILGIFLGFGVIYWLRSANRPLKEEDSGIQISITVCSAYLIFFVAQYSLQISGALACCFAGLMLSWLSPPIILSRESMHNVWSIIEWMGNTLIFLLAGLIIGHRSLGHVRVMDWLYVVVLYLAMMAVRCLVIGLSFPFLSNYQHKCSIYEAAFISWAGLRGALSMALALILENDKNLSCSEKETSRILFYAGGIAALTLLFNATLTNKVLSWLELIDDNVIEKELIMHQIRKKIKKDIIKVLKNMYKQSHLNIAELEEIRMSCSLLRDYDLEDFKEPPVIAADSRATPVNLFTPITPIFKVPSTALCVDDDDNDNDNDDDGIDNLINATAGNANQGGKNSFSFASFGPTGVHITNRTPSYEPLATTPSTVYQTPRDQHKRSSSKGGRTKSITDIFVTSKQSFHDIHDRINRLLSQSNRDMKAIDLDLLAYIRGIFLEIVRVKYYNLIEKGSLPRLSHSAQYLLYTIDVGMDDLRNEDGLLDWYMIDQFCTTTPVGIRLLMIVHHFYPFRWLTSFLAKLTAKHDKRCVYVLTSFIEAHQHAQKKIHTFVGMDADDLNVEIEKDYQNLKYLMSPEEVKTIEESERAVREAKEILSSFPSDVLSSIQSKQIARSILSKEADIVKGMLDEGLLTRSHAEEFLEEISKDVATIEAERNSLYKELAKRKAKIIESERDSLISLHNPLV